MANKLFRAIPAEGSYCLKSQVLDNNGSLEFPSFLRSWLATFQAWISSNV